MVTESGDSRHGGYGHNCWDGCDAMTDDTPTGRLSPLLCIDCEKFYGEVSENDTINAVTLANLHKSVCPARKGPTGRLTDEQIWEIEKEESKIPGSFKDYFLRFSRRIEAIVRKDMTTCLGCGVHYRYYCGSCRDNYAEKARKDEREEFKKWLVDVDDCLICAVLVNDLCTKHDAILRDDKPDEKPTCPDCRSSDPAVRGPDPMPEEGDQACDHPFHDKPDDRDACDRGDA